MSLGFAVGWTVGWAGVAVAAAFCVLTDRVPSIGRLRRSRPLRPLDRTKAALALFGALAMAAMPALILVSDSRG